MESFKVGQCRIFFLKRGSTPKRALTLVRISYFFISICHNFHWTEKIKLSFEIIFTRVVKDWNKKIQTPHIKFSGNVKNQNQSFWQRRRNMSHAKLKSHKTFNITRKENHFIHSTRFASLKLDINSHLGGEIANLARTHRARFPFLLAPRSQLCSLRQVKFSDFPDCGREVMYSANSDGTTGLCLSEPRETGNVWKYWDHPSQIPNLELNSPFPVTSVFTERNNWKNHTDRNVCP